MNGVGVGDRVPTELVVAGGDREGDRKRDGVFGRERNVVGRTGLAGVVGGQVGITGSKSNTVVAVSAAIDAVADVIVRRIQGGTIPEWGSRGA